MKTRLLKAKAKQVLEMLVNGTSHFGQTIEITKKHVLIDGVIVQDTSPEIKIEIHGDCEQLETASGDVAIQGSANTIKTMSGDVDCADVYGPVSTMSGDVKCKDVHGSVSTMSGDIRKGL